MTMRLLILGGTRDARLLADQLINQGIEVVYSIKGLVRKPALDCDVLVGGFSQFNGMAAWVQENGISAILDATHPYASRISQQAIDASSACNIPYWLFYRKAWVPEHDDCWIAVNDWSQALEKLHHANKIFLSAGQLPNTVLSAIRSDFQSKTFLLRTAVKPQAILPSHVHWIKAIGPFSETDEMHVLQTYGIDMIVSKNSGGDSTFAKIKAARTLNIPVVMLERPERPENTLDDQVFYALSDCVEHCAQFFATLNNQSPKR